MNLTVANTLWFFKIVAWVWLAFSSIRHRHLLKYRLIYVYVSSNIVLDSAMPYVAAKLGTKSMAYAYLYVATSLFTLVLAGAVVLSIHFTMARLYWRRDWHLIAVPFGLVLLGSTDTEKFWLPILAVNLGYAILSYLGTATLYRMQRTRGFDLGWNLKMVLFALTVPASFFTLVFIAYHMGLAVSYQGLGLWIQATVTAFWVILAVGMSEYSPPGRRTVVQGPAGQVSSDESGSGKPVIENAEAG